ncbi:MAG TPA: response regulator [Acidimicrobiales bacterium]|nr:response regulator [Acidimicrobiales bacterium]
MPDVLIASDEAWVRDEVGSVLSALPDTTVREVVSGAAVVPAVKESLPDLVILDLQIGNMGAMAVCLDLHLERASGRAGYAPVLMLLDRRDDVFLARRSDADGWLIKPVDPIRMRKAVTALLEGGTYHDESYKPTTVPSESS